MNREILKVNLLLILVALFSALVAGCSKDTSITPQEINTQKAADDALITKYLADNNIKPTGVVDSAGTATGIYYTIDSVGTPGTLYTNSTQVTVGYTAWPLNSNATLGVAIQQTDQYHPSFILGDLMEGWQLPFEYIPVSSATSGNSVPGPGGAITLYVPSHYAYGPYLQPTLGLAANTVLIFHIDIYNVLN